MELQAAKAVGPAWEAAAVAYDAETRLDKLRAEYQEEMERPDPEQDESELELRHAYGDR